MTDHGGHGGSVEPLCRSCAYNARVVTAEVRANEKRLSNGQPINTAVITACKRAMSECSNRNHGRLRVVPDSGEAS